MTVNRMTIRTFLDTRAGRILYNFGVVIAVFLFMSLGINVFAEQPGVRSNDQNPVTHYLWQMAHHQDIQALGKQVDYLHGRMYLFKRMQGDPSTWGWSQQATYDQLYQEYMNAIARYNDLAARYNGDATEGSTDFAPKTIVHDYMPYARR